MSARVIARLRIPLLLVSGITVVVGVTFEAAPWLVLTAIALTFVALALYFRIGTVRADPTPVRPPVVGRWSALNSPGSKVPSHGIHAYGQTYAIDFVHVPEGPYAPQIGWRPATRSPGEDRYPGFGQPVVAPVGGTVVRVHGRERDHRTRDSWPGLIMFLIEGIFRELTGPSRIVGNHVVIETSPGFYAMVAHLQRGSITVQKGDRVEAGQRIAACGNSGSSTEPHVHFQLMDRPGVLLAAGLPFTLTDAHDDDGQPMAMPATGQAMTAG